MWGWCVGVTGEGDSGLRMSNIACNHTGVRPRPSLPRCSPSCLPVGFLLLHCLTLLFSPSLLASGSLQSWKYKYILMCALSFSLSLSRLFQIYHLKNPQNLF